MAKRSSDGESLERFKRIGRLSYSRKDRLGAGSFGSVFKGKYKEPGKPEIDVAIKRIENIDVKDIEKIVLEKLEPHPNVLHYYWTEEDDDFIYIATELCAGTLEDIIQAKYKGPPVGSPREMMHQIALGLEHLHKNKIVHRDIKPANILVSIPDPETNGPPKMKLADFGLCRVVKNDGSENPLTKCGTRGWMAPELLTNVPSIQQNGEATFAVDVFSLGCVFAYSLSKGNKHPYGTGNFRDYRMENKEEMILTVNDFDQHGKVFHLITFMLFPHAPYRYSIEEVVQHAFFMEGINREHDESWNFSLEYETLISSMNHLESSSFMDVNSTDSNGRTPLMLLCQRKINEVNRKQRDYIKTFLRLPNDYEKTLNAKDNSGDTALILLCENYDGDDLVDIIRLLIQKGSDVNIVNAKNGFNALMMLCIQNNRDNLIDIVRIFIDNGVDVNAKSTDDHWNVLHILCRYYNNDKLVEVVALLIEKGVNLNEVTRIKSWNVTFFLFYHYTGEYMLKIIRLLIENGINLLHKCDTGLNAFGFLCYLYNRKDFIDIMRLFIEKDSTAVNCINRRDGFNPFLYMCQEYSRSGNNNLYDIVLLLIENDIDVKFRSLKGLNALMLVCRYYRHANLIDIVKLLVDHGIGINSKVDGANAFLIICANEYLHHSICYDAIRLMIDLKADVNAVYEVDSENALTILCKYHHNCDKLVDIIRLILDHEACTIDINHKNKKGENALSILKSKGRLVKDSELIMQLLIQRGANY